MYLAMCHEVVGAAVGSRLQIVKDGACTLGERTTVPLWGTTPALASPWNMVLRDAAMRAGMSVDGFAHARLAPDQPPQPKTTPGMTLQVTWQPRALPALS